MRSGSSWKVLPTQCSNKTYCHWAPSWPTFWSWLCHQNAQTPLPPRVCILKSTHLNWCHSKQLQNTIVRPSGSFLLSQDAQGPYLHKGVQYPCSSSQLTSPHPGSRNSSGWAGSPGSSKRENMAAPRTERWEQEQQAPSVDTARVASASISLPMLSNK